MFKTIRVFSKEDAHMSYDAIRKLAIQNKIPYVMVGNRRMIHVEGAMSALKTMANQNVGKGIEGDV